jgi:type IX secretion system PorP/SprF family membrane protein
LKIAGLKIAIIVIGSGFFLAGEIRAQDIHYTQIQAAPLLLNPATTGVSDYDFRLVNNYRNQWRNIEKSYNTYSLSADQRIFIGKQPLGVGACMVHDMSMGNQLIADKFYACLSFSRFFRNHQFVLGVQPGVVFRHFNQKNTTFNSQFNSIDEKFSTAYPSYENLLADKLSYFDFNAGLLWRARIRNYQLASGFTVCHLNRPVESFTKIEGDDHLPLRYNLQANLLIPLTRRVDAVPMILYSQTSNAHELVGGSLFGYAFTDPVVAVKSVYALALLRINTFTNFDALMVGAGLRILKFDLCISYDMNLSALRKATNFYGAFEISLIYRNINARSKEPVRPCYML